MQVTLLRTLVGGAALAGVLAVATPTAANAATPQGPDFKELDRANATPVGNALRAVVDDDVAMLLFLSMLLRLLLLMLCCACCCLPASTTRWWCWCDVVLVVAVLNAETNTAPVEPQLRSSSPATTRAAAVTTQAIV